MNPEQLSVALRQRTPWEAIDLGFAMVREWWRDVYAVWLLVVIPVSAILCAVLGGWAILAIWWLKPAFDRVALHVLASAVFGTRPGWRAALRAFPQYAFNGMLWYLTLARLSPYRSFTMPARQLEGARGSEGRARVRQLTRRGSSQAGWLMLICVNFELVVMVSLAGLYVLLAPGDLEDIPRTLRWLVHLDRGSQEIAYAVVYTVAMALIEPFYVAGGFALYLNRRTALEGWDLEVELRRLSQADRTQPISRAPLTTTVVIAALVMALAWGAASPPAQAQSEPAQPARPLSAQEAVKEILKDPMFGHAEETTKLRRKHSEEDKPPERNLKGFAAFMQALAEILRVGAWIVLAVVIALAAYWLSRNLRFTRNPTPPRAVIPDLLFGLDVRPESLPPDIAAAAAAHLARGDLVAALSLLYRGALVALLHRHAVELTGGDTESQCLAKIAPRVAQPMHTYLVRLVGCWQAAAYAHRLPPAAEVDALVQEWRGLFGGSGA